MKPRMLALGALLLLGACGSPPPAPAPEPPAAAAPQAPAGQRLRELVEGWFEDYLKLNPVAATFIGDHRYDAELAVPDAAHEAAVLALHRKGLEGTQGIDPGELGPADRVTWEAFAWARQLGIDNASHPGRLLPLDPLDNPAIFLAWLGSGEGVQPFATVRDYERFAVRMSRFPTWVDQAINDMRTGIERGIVPPRVVVERLVAQAAAIAAPSAEESVFWQPIARLPREFSAADRARLTRSYRDVVSGAVLPAYQRLLGFLRGDYLRQSRASIGLSALPDGRAWYAFLAHAYTSLDTPVEEIHAIGLREVAAIEAEIARTAARAGLEGDAPRLARVLRGDPRLRPADADALLDAYREVGRQVQAAAPRLFAQVPAARLDIRPMEAFRAGTTVAAAEYRAPAADGSRPGILYVNTTAAALQAAYPVEALFLHEALPGHHLQVSLAMENDGLPRFQRLAVEDAFVRAPAATTAFAEGWASYAEGLGRELGPHADPRMQLGSLFAGAWRAALLVVDTGIHARDWSRQQAIDYLLAHTALTPAAAAAEVERCIARPGRALAYKMGELTIRRLRHEAEQALGQRFDLRAFHAAVLEDGALPLSVLEAKLGRWIESGTAGQVPET